MKIAIGSDLHIERPGGAIVLEGEGDVLILAGDIVPVAGLNERYGDMFSELLESAEANFNHVLMVMGNHEHYSYNFATTLADLRKRLNKTILLEKERIVIDGVTFLGGTLWTDMNRNHLETVLLAKVHMNDYTVIRNGMKSLTPYDTMADHSQMVEFLKRELTFNEKTVVVTHHAPSTLSIAEEYMDDWIANGYFASNMFEFIYDRPHIKLWVHGHTHRPFDYLIGDTRVVCNPRGYIDLEPGAKSFQLKFVEV